jgi:hypothetical protein
MENLNEYLANLNQFSRIVIQLCSGLFGVLFGTFLYLVIAHYRERKRRLRQIRAKLWPDGNWPEQANHF